MLNDVIILLLLSLLTGYTISDITSILSAIGTRYFDISSQFTNKHQFNFKKWIIAAVVIILTIIKVTHKDIILYNYQQK